MLESTRTRLYGLQIGREDALPAAGADLVRITLADTGLGLSLTGANPRKQ